jgi:hypothetical protein
MLTVAEVSGVIAAAVVIGIECPDGVVDDSADSIISSICASCLDSCHTGKICRDCKYRSNMVTASVRDRSVTLCSYT